MRLRVVFVGFIIAAGVGFVLGSAVAPVSAQRHYAATGSGGLTFGPAGTAGLMQPANNSYSQQALAADANFRKRLAAALATVAWQVINEDEQTANHEQRKNYARATVLPNLAGTAAQIAPWMVMRPNVLNFATTYDFALGAVVTASGDADLESQIAADWNILAGV